MSSCPSGDLADWTTLKSLLGELTQVSTTEHFAIVHAAGADYISGTGRILECACRQFYEDFSAAGFDLTRPEDRLVWICFPQRDRFDRYAIRVEGTDSSWLDGYYSILTNRVAVVEPGPRLPQRAGCDPSPERGRRADSGANAPRHEDILAMPADQSQMDLARLTHELAHQLAFNSGLQKRGVMYPFWVSEGLAANFERDRLEGPGRAGHSTARRSALVKMYVLGELVPLRLFVIQTEAPVSFADSRRHYAQAWAFFQFLLTQRSESLRGYLDRMAILPPGRRLPAVLLREFTDSFGWPEEIENSWHAFLDRQVQLERASAGSVPTIRR